MDNIKAKIQELVPEVMEDKCNCLHCTYPVHRDFTQPITLAVVLRAIEKAEKFYAVDESGFFMQLKEADLERNIYGAVERCEWKLEHDNYDQQSAECKQFIGSLLGI